MQALLELRTIRDAEGRIALEETAGHATLLSGNGDLGAAQLDLTPRVLVELIGMTIVASNDGLALDHELARDTRVAFDVFWLAILSLGN